MDGLWLVGDYQQDQFKDDTRVLTWKVHCVLGWDGARRCYQGHFFDSNGVAAMCEGAIESDRFVLRSHSPISFGGQLAALRFTWDAAAHPAIRWTNEISIGGGPWQLVEEYLMTSAG